jgi:hypothetical protein
MPPPTRNQQLNALINRVSAQPTYPNQGILIDPSTQPDLPATNQILFDNGSGPLTAGNINGTQSLAVTLASVQSGSGRNILTVPGVVPMAFAPTGIWKLTAIISGGARSKTTSVIWSSPSSDISSALSMAKTWAGALANTFGNAGSGSQDLVASAQSPRVTFLRVSDAINPRYGQLVATDPTSTAYSGWNGTGSYLVNDADFLAVAMSLRLNGVTTDNQSGYANHALLGVPDQCVVKGDQISFAPTMNTNSFGYWVNVYISFLVNPGNNLGFLMVPATELKMQVTKFAYVAPLWQLTVTGHGYNALDRVRLTGVNVSGFNGQYKIQVLDANTLGLVNGPPSSTPVPTAGFVRRYQLNTGVRLGILAKFILSAGQNAPPFGLQVSKRNPRRYFSPVSFRKKVRRLGYRAQ